MINLFDAAHAAALEKLVAGLPVADILATLAGRETLDDGIRLAEKLAGLIGAAFPPAALTAAEIAFALEALRLLLDAAHAGAAPISITAGYPDIVGQENATNFKDR